MVPYRALVIFLSLNLLGLSSLQAKPLELTEKQILTWAQQENPRSQQFRASQLRAEVSSSLQKTQYDPRLQLSYAYSSSNEDPLVSFFPVYKPSKNLQAQIVQKTPYGASLKAGVLAEQINTANGLINNATQVGTLVGFEMDLWKNFLGSLDRSQLNARDVDEKIAQLQAAIDQNAFGMDLRKLYWSLVANEMSLQLSRELTKTAEKQLRDSRQRLKEGAGDSGDVARNQAQLESRKSAALMFQYQKEVLLSNLRALLPQTEAHELEIVIPNVSQMENKVSMCLSQIVQTPVMQSSYSQYSEIINLLKQKNEHEIKNAEQLDSMEIKLQGQYKASGVDTNHSDAFDKLNEEFKNGYQVGVNLSIPLGSDIADAKRGQVQAVKYQIESQRQQLQLRLAAEHRKVQRALALLSEATKSQKNGVNDLARSLQQTQKKYRQARVSLSTLVLEQDSLFQAKLQEIDTKKQVLHVLFDYFKLFPQFPCEVNGKGGRS